MAREIKQMKSDGIYKNGMMNGMKKGMKKGKKVENTETCPKCGRKKSECGCDYD